MEDALAESMARIGEVRRTDVLVLGAPLYNYVLPESLIAWIDLIIRVDRTFSFDLQRGDFPMSSTLHGKSLVILTARGEFRFESGGIRNGRIHLNPPSANCRSSPA